MQRHLTRAAATVAALVLALTALVSVSPARAAGTGHFQARDGLIFDPQGREFLPIGANVGATKTFDWRGTAYGHAKEARDWGWNTVRLNLLATDVIDWSYIASYGYDRFLADTDALVKEYTGAGIVVMIDAHDDIAHPAGREAEVAQQLDRFWGDMGRRYRDNPYVWFNLHNEPPVTNQKWFEVHDRHAGIVRATGAKNPIVVDAPGWGQDIGPQEQFFPGSKFAYEADMAPALNKKHGNVILSQHNYGAYDRYTTPEKFAAYADRVRAAGLSLVIGEYGYTIDGSSTAGGWQPNKAGADAFFAIHRSKKLGGLWWHATHGDNYSLKEDGSAFFAYGAGNRLSEAGRRLWDLGHATPAPTATPTATKPAPTPAPTTPATVVVTDRSESTFGFSYAPMPAGGSMTITWTRGGVGQSTTTSTGNFWSGSQTGYSDAQAVVRDAAGREVARSEVVRPSGAAAPSLRFTDHSAETFGVEASAMPAGGTLTITWRRWGGQLQSTTRADGSFWSGPQPGYGDVMAYLKDAQGTVVASAGPLQRP